MGRVRKILVFAKMTSLKENVCRKQELRVNAFSGQQIRCLSVKIRAPDQIGIQVGRKYY